MSGMVRCWSACWSRPAVPPEIDRLVDGADPSARLAAEESERTVVLRPRVGERPAEDHAPDRHAVAVVRAPGSDVSTANLAGQLGRGPLVGVDREDPVARGQPQRRVALAGEVVEGPERDPVGRRDGDGLGLIAAGGDRRRTTDSSAQRTEARQPGRFSASSCARIRTEMRGSGMPDRLSDSRRPAPARGSRRRRRPAPRRAGPARPGRSRDASGCRHGRQSDGGLQHRRPRPRPGRAAAGPTRPDLLRERSRTSAPRTRICPSRRACPGRATRDGRRGERGPGDRGVQGHVAQLVEVRRRASGRTRWRSPGAGRDGRRRCRAPAPAPARQPSRRARLGPAGPSATATAAPSTSAAEASVRALGRTRVGQSAGPAVARGRAPSSGRAADTTAGAVSSSSAPASPGAGRAARSRPTRDRFPRRPRAGAASGRRAGRSAGSPRPPAAGRSRTRPAPAGDRRPAPGTGDAPPAAHGRRSAPRLVQCQRQVEQVGQHGSVPSTTSSARGPRGPPDGRRSRGAGSERRIGRLLAAWPPTSGISALASGVLLAPPCGLRNGGGHMRAARPRISDQEHQVSTARSMHLSLAICLLSLIICQLTHFWFTTEIV